MGSRRSAASHIRCEDVGIIFRGLLLNFTSSSLRSKSGIPAVWWTCDRRNAMTTRLRIDDHFGQPNPRPPATYGPAEGGGCGLAAR